MDISALLIELYGRVPPLARQAVDGVDVARLRELPGPGTNSIGWLIWHLTRVQDHHVSDLVEADQVWVTGDWAGRFGLEPDPENVGWGHTADDVATVRPDGAEVLVEYLDAVGGRTGEMFEALQPGDLDRIVDRGWDPPVTMGVRLVSIAADSFQHVGQALYLRGLFGI